MNSPELQPYQLMQIVAEFLETHGVNYRVVGSLASMSYGEPRFTNDVDIMADLTVSVVGAVCRAFPAPDYYVSEQAVREAVRKRSQFHIIHPASGLKVDIFVAPDTEFARSSLTRGMRLTSDGEFSAWFGSPEDVLLNKLLYFQKGGSEKHLRDIAGMMKLLGDKLERSYVERWAEKLGVISEWQLICERLRSATE